MTRFEFRIYGVWSWIVQEPVSDIYPIQTWASPYLHMTINRHNSFCFQTNINVTDSLGWCVIEIIAVAYHCYAWAIIIATSGVSVSNKQPIHSTSTTPKVITDELPMWYQTRDIYRSIFAKTLVRVRKPCNFTLTRNAHYTGGLISWRWYPTGNLYWLQWHTSVYYLMIWIF